MRILSWVLALAVLGTMPNMASAQDVVPQKRLLVSDNIDLPGGDIASLFDTTPEACQIACFTNSQCQALTFNSRNSSCFLKAQTGEPAEFQGAFSAQVINTPTRVLGKAAERRGELEFVPDGTIAEAKTFAEGLGLKHSTSHWSAQAHLQSAQNSEDNGDWRMAVNFTGAALNRADTAENWLNYARRSLRLYEDDNSNYSDRDNAIIAALNAYLRATDSDDRHAILVQLAHAYEAAGQGRMTLDALTLAQQIQDRRDTAEYLAQARGKYGFNVDETRVEADLARPRICVDFNQSLAKSGVEYADYVKLSDPSLAVELDGDRSLCIAGLTHGTQATITLRAGLPAADGSTLPRMIEVSHYVRDRAPRVNFPGRGYILPQGPEASLPISSVNTDKIDLSLYKISDRNLLRMIQISYLGASLDTWSEQDFADQMGENLWKGSATVQRDVNKDVLTRLPMEEALAGRDSGIYALKAQVPGVDSNDAPPSWQWFVVSDLGVSSLSGVDGLHVFVRSLNTTAAKVGTKVELLNRANSILGESKTDAQGYAHFEPGLLHGVGASAPALLVVSEGDSDLVYLSLSDPEFDLSDRGVEGRAAAKAVDVFLTTDRGAYRAGETVYATALARDPELSAVEGLPLTAILKRPDGVEYSRQLVNDSGAGGHIFSLPIAATAPRGMWRLQILADVTKDPLSQTTFLVEDFLPERIDFKITSDHGEGLVLSQGQAEFSVDAKYLFGAPAADLAIEGEFVLRAAKNVAGFDGYHFGLHDQEFSTVYETLSGATTDAEGKALLEVNLPQIEDPGQPLEGELVVRVAEGSGRPVERRLAQTVAPVSPLIGVKPLFDDVAPEGREARFQVVALGQDWAPTAMDARWTLSRIATEYQWYQAGGSWQWEPITRRTQVASGDISLTADGAEVGALVEWGEYELRVEGLGAGAGATSMTFWAGWYAPADVTTTPDTLQLSLDKSQYRSGEQAQLRVVPRSAGTALISVLSNRLIAMKTVEVSEGENLIDLDVTDEWGAGVYVTASVIHPLDRTKGRNPTRSLGLSYAKIDPGVRALNLQLETQPEAQPRGSLDIAVKVDGVVQGEVAYVTLAAVDQGILNLTGYKAPDPQGYYFGQRQLGVGLRDVYGRLIDGVNGAMGIVRSGGDAGAGARLQAAPPTEKLVAYFTGPIAVGEDGYARTSFDLPAFNGSVKVMAVGWSKTGVGQAQAEVLVRDPIVLSASLPRFMAPGDESRVLLEFQHVFGPSGDIGLKAQTSGIELGALPTKVTLADQGKAVLELPITAMSVGVQTITVTLTDANGATLEKELTLPVEVNDPEVMHISKVALKTGETLSFDQALFSDMRAGTGVSVVSIGPLAQLNAPGLLDVLERYPYGCTEQMTSRIMPLLYHDQIATVMGLLGKDQLKTRVDESLREILANQGAEGGFGLWGPGEGNLWLDAYVSDFLSRARGQGYAVPEQAFRRALENLRNQVNYAMDFDAQTNEGGVGLAYALMVLAREGGAAIGDLRYYADVKGDDFATPLAQAQLGAALAAYGDQPRADMMMRKAVTALSKLPMSAPEQVWRSDYGSAQRDSAGVLALAAETGSVIDQAALVDRVRKMTNASTQEAAWGLLASKALADQGKEGGILINGQPPQGPMVKVLKSGDDQEISIKNNGPDTEITLTTYGVPDVPEPASGNGYAIERSYYTLSGQEVDIANVSTAERLVAVLRVIPYSDVNARLILDDPLPAGFEIDNLNLISAGNTTALAWINDLTGLDPEDAVQHREFRQDRFIAQVDWGTTDPFRLAYMVRAISPGRYHHPAAKVEDMYNPMFRAISASGQVVIGP